MPLSRLHRGATSPPRVDAGAVGSGPRLVGAAWERRHERVLFVLVAHVPALLVFGMVSGVGAVRTVVGIVPLVVCTAVAASLRLRPRARSVAASIGLMAAAAALVHLADGRTEAHFLYFVLLGLLGAYDDWVPYAAAVGFVLVEHGVIGFLAPEAVWGISDAPHAAGSLTAVHGGFVLAASVVTFVSWRWREKDRTEAEQRVRASEEQFRRTFEAAPIGMALVGVDGRFLRVNPALCTIVGYSAAALADTTFQAITHPDDVQADLDLLRGCLAGSIDGYEMVKRYIHHDGHDVWIELSVAVARDSTGAVTHFVAQIVDITERRSAVASLAASEARFAALVEHGRDLTSITDADGRLIYASPAYQTVLGFDPAERIGQELQEQIHPDDQARVLAVGLELAATPGDSATLEFRYAHADGSWRWVEATLTNRLDDPAVGGFVTNTHDVTDRVLAAERLAHQAAHDPLTGLPNRTLLADRMVQASASALRHDELLAALFVDVDHLKAVNDTYGHGTGDVLLVEVATRLRAAVRVDDTVIRFGGDEFVVIACLRDEAAATELAARVCAAFRAPFLLGDLMLSVTVSVGVATTGGPGDEAGLLDAADVALYEAKALGRDGWVAYLPQMRSQTRGSIRRHDGGAAETAGRGPAPELGDDQPQVAARYRAYITDSPQAIVVHDGGFVVAVSPPAVRLLEAESPEALLGLHVFDVVTAESLTTAQGRQRAVEAGGWPLPELIEITTLAGRTVAVEVASTPVFWEERLASQLTLRPASDLANGPDQADTDLLRELADAIPGGQLIVAYQPIVGPSGHVSKVEALVRWQHPTRGLLQPDAFIPAVERTSLMGSVTAEVLRQSCAQVVWWRLGGMPHLELSVNISGGEVAEPGLVGRVSAALDTSGLPADALWLELTETALAQDAAQASVGLAQLSHLGVRIALDDFGTGFATLAQLHEFPAHALKIDRLFVDGIEADDGGDAAIVRSVLALGRELGLQVIAEGVETAAQHAALITMGCELFQGYLFARPSFPEPPPAWVQIGGLAESAASMPWGWSRPSASEPV